jgi:hypothetical protein
LNLRNERTADGQDQPDRNNFEAWGHFSQIVWQSSTYIGCATVDRSAGGLANTDSGIAPWFTVSNYKPPGNVDGEYGANIAQPLGTQSLLSPLRPIYAQL